jgi:hypothetical protein
MIKKLKQMLGLGGSKAETPKRDNALVEYGRAVVDEAVRNNGRQDKSRLKYHLNVKKAAINSLLTTRNLSGKMRRQLMRNTHIPIVQGGVPAEILKENAERRIVRQLTGAKLSQLLKWSRRTPRKMRHIMAAMKRATDAGNTKAENRLKAFYVGAEWRLELLRSEIFLRTNPSVREQLQPSN